jgi:hypothetical protein
MGPDSTRFDCDPKEQTRFWAAFGSCMCIESADATRRRRLCYCATLSAHRCVLRLARLGVAARSTCLYVLGAPWQMRARVPSPPPQPATRVGVPNATPRHCTKMNAIGALSRLYTHADKHWNLAMALLEPAKLAEIWSMGPLRSVP